MKKHETVGLFWARKGEGKRRRKGEGTINVAHSKMDE